jgi:hypothetical protein
MKRFPISCPPWVLHFLVSLGSGLFMVGSQSLWIDEGQTLLLTRQSSFSDWMTALLANQKSEAQMPLSMFVAWIAGKVLGESEWQIRSLNALWVALAGTAVGRLGQVLRLPSLLPLFLVQPFLWYYANEARPYALLICISAWLVAVWGSVHQEGALSPARLWAVCGLTVAGLACSLLFSFAIVGFTFAFAATVVTRRIVLTRRHLLPPAGALLAVATLMAYYLWTLKRGATGAKLWGVGLSNMAFAFYELLGFGGLGPPRHELREMAHGSGGIEALTLLGGYLVGLALLALSYLALVRSAWKLRKDSMTLIAMGTVVLSTGAMFAASAVVGFPFWGRHLAFSLPITVLLISKAAAAMERILLRRLLTVSLSFLLLASSLCQRFVPRYGKDDYRSASRMATAALRSGKTVWWAADHVTAQYYGLGGPAVQTNSGRLIWFNVENERDTRNKPVPDLIFLSKPEIHDPENNVVSYINEYDYHLEAQLIAFRIYTRSARQD